MSKKQRKKEMISTRPAPQLAVNDTPGGSLGFEDMLTELEAIVREAEVRLAQEEALA